MRKWEWSKAEDDFKRAIELDPGYGTAHQWYATLLAITGRVEQAKAEMSKALEIDPMSHNFLADMGQMHYFAREYDEAESYCHKALEVDPNFAFAKDNLKHLYLKTGKDAQFFEVHMRTHRDYFPSSTYSTTESIIARHQARDREIYRRLGLRGMWKEQIEAMHTRIEGVSYHGLFFYYTLLGEKGKALEALEKSYEHHDFMLPFANADPLFDELRSEPRFQAVSSHGSGLLNVGISRSVLSSGAGIRVAPHFYSKDEELELTIQEIKKILETKAYEQHAASAQ